MLECLDLILMNYDVVFSTGYKLATNKDVAVSERLDVSLLAQSGSGNRCDGRERKTVCLQVGAVISLCLAIRCVTYFP